jgi:hypothetical protein
VPKNLYESTYLTNDVKKITYEDGTKYEGQLKTDKPHGKGTMKYADGDIYTGEWNNGKKTKGTMTYSDGEIIEGPWKNGLPTGPGVTYTAKDKSIIATSTYKNSHPINFSQIIIKDNYGFSRKEYIFKKQDDNITCNNQPLQKTKRLSELLLSLCGTNIRYLGHF